VLRIILAGQPDLNEKLDSPELVQLRQRVRLRFHLSALTEENTTEYVPHRLRVAGAGDRELFEPATFPIIYRYSGGIPRLINTLCDTSLLAAFAQDEPTVTVAAVTRGDRRAAVERAGTARGRRSRRSTIRRDTCARRSGRSCSRSTERCSARRCSCQADS
jgi:hypothetical protein